MNPWVVTFQKRLDSLYDNREAKNIAYWVLQEVCECNLTEILLGKCDQLNEEQSSQIEDILNRLSLGEPIQHILGTEVFHGLTFQVNGNVLIPRPETEELVEWISADFQRRTASFLDIGTGSGCIAITLKETNKLLEAHAMDISKEALAVAKGNARNTGAEVDFIEDDILHPQTDIKDLDFIVSNPPYITEAEKTEMRQNVLAYEPHLALFVEDNNPLLFYEAIADFGLSRLKEEGLLYFEINEHFGKEICEMLQKRGYKEIVLKQDMQGKDRMIRCRKKR